MEKTNQNNFSDRFTASDNAEVGSALFGRTTKRLLANQLRISDFMSVRRWASQDLVLAAFCVAAITLGLWPDEPTRQMIHSLDPEGNTSSYSLSLDDSRLARLSRELGRRQNPPPTREIVLAKWRMDLAGHYTRRLDPAAGSGAPAPEKTSPELQSGGMPVVQIGFATQPTTQVAQTIATSDNGTVARELAFWRGVSQKSKFALESANHEMAEKIASQGPPAIVLGEVFEPSKSANAWITAILLGLLASCIFADWQMRSPKITITRADVTRADVSRDTQNLETEDSAADVNDGAVRIQIPIEWIRIHQPLSVQVRRATLVCLVIAAVLTNYSGVLASL